MLLIYIVLLIGILMKNIVTQVRKIRVEIKF